ncbi:hypothetical protein N7481_002367 [Penicillium waksmanii]|uniref:uncharacterized protein n=1 Tax=Penicillium waksmanii TaxID=69791 RepID=UPI0025491CA1|nr:uncharacterized protein N7481_002367 [Penicillium waksmanii]KAJ5995390.1 hypothetical protein N7481_002367 [Penicillium waksmanii]
MAVQRSLCEDAVCEKSCWQEALEKLQTENPDIHQQLERILATQKQPLSRSNMSSQIAKSIQANQSRLEERSLPGRWRNRDEGGKAKVRKAMDRILKAVVVFRDMGKVLVEIEPSHVGVAWSGVNLVLQIVLGGPEQNAAAIEGLAQISLIITRYARVEEIYIEQRQQNQSTTLSKDFRTQVVDLYAKILAYQVAIISHCQRQTINKIVQHRELKQILEEQDQQMDNVSTQLSQLYEQNQVLISQAQLSENRTILNWISPSSPNDDHTRILEHGKLNSEYAGSGRWLFSCPEFQSWSSVENENVSTLWLRGPVGTGKSSLVCLAIEKFLKGPILETSLIAYFYCSKKQGMGDANSPKAVLQSLLRQLAWSTSDLSISPLIKAKYMTAQQNPAAGTSGLLVDDCLHLLNQLIAGYQQVTIVIDALDECSDFFELLSHLVDISSACEGKVRFLLSSRMNVPVHQFFSESATIEVGQDGKEDVDFFIATEMERNLRRLTQCNALDLKDKMTRVLSHRAQGMFRWVELQLNLFFNTKSPIKRRDAFKRKLDKLDEQGGVPVLADVYDDIYDINTPEPEDRQVAERALKWVMCCERPLNIDMMVKAVSYYDCEGNVDEQVTVDYILDICSNFIIVDHNHMVQFAHLSVREYLMNDTKLNYTNIDANIQVAKTTLVYLTACSTDSTGPSSNAKTGKRDDLLEYAILYWPHHCSWLLLQEEKDASLHKLLSEFLAANPPSDGFLLCLDTWPELLPEIENWEERRKLEFRMVASLSPSKSPVFTACRWGFQEAVQGVISSGFDLSERNNAGNTALSVAAQADRMEVMKLLLENGADPNTTGEVDGVTPLHLVYYDIDKVKLLAEHGADITRAVKGSINSGWMLLHFSACHNVKEGVEFALDHGTDVNEQTSTGLTALHLTSTHATDKTIEIFKMLLDRGADPEIRSEDGQTVLERAAIHGSNEIIRLILKHQGKENEAERWFRQAAFHDAVCQGDEDAVQRLIEEGVNFKVKANRGELPIHWAIKNGNAGVALVLLREGGADIDARDKFGETPLAMACMNSDQEMMHFLLDQGAEIDFILGEGDAERTLLSRVVTRGEVLLVDLLLKRGADPRKVDLDSLEREGFVKVDDFDACVKMVRSHLV